MHKIFRCAMLRAGICGTLACAAQALAAPAGWVAVEAATLAQARGGFTTPAGLQVSLGIERVVAINGEVQSRTSFQLADIGRLGAEQAAQTRAALSEVKLIQNGSDNIALAALAESTLGGIIIQNSLSDQRIQSRTLINASVNSAGPLMAIHFNGSVSDAIARAASPR
jgi:hypothetical protein